MSYNVAERRLTEFYDLQDGEKMADISQTVSCSPPTRHTDTQTRTSRRHVTAITQRFAFRQMINTTLCIT